MNKTNFHNDQKELDAVGPVRELCERGCSWWGQPEHRLTTVEWRGCWFVVWEIWVEWKKEVEKWIVD